MEDKPKFYIATAIAYANGSPHIGHAYEIFLADVIARYKRDRGFDVFFLTGTDEHGAKNANTAKKNGMAPQDFVDARSQEFRDFYRTLEISNDDFIRTSNKERHWPGAQELWKKLEEAGDIYKGKYSGLYCVGCEAYKTEKELVNGLCPDHNVAPQKIEEENYFFRVSKYADTIKQKISSGELLILPEARKNEMLALFEEGMSDVSFSRPKEQNAWGIPVPGSEDQVMYVWCDALANYITALGYGTEHDEKFRRFWPADIHVIGKDIQRFHVFTWPAMLLSAGLPLPHAVLIHGHITSDGKKMSKSIGNVIDPVDYITRYGSEALRSYFGREIPPFEDGDFTEAKFLESYNTGLANGLGNLVSRVVKMAGSYFEGSVTKKGDENISLEKEIEAGASEYHSHMENFEINKASADVWKMLKRMDQYVTEYEPYKLVKTDKEKTEAVLWNLLNGLSVASELLAPFVPDTAEKIKVLLGRKGETFTVGQLEAPLFPRK